MNTNLYDEKILQIFRESQIELFDSFNKKNPDMLKFSIDYATNKFIACQNCNEVDPARHFQNRNESFPYEYELIAFLGLDNKYPTHQNIKDTRIFSAILSSLIKINQFPSLFLDKIIHAMEFHYKKSVNMTARNYWYYTYEVTNLSFDIAVNKYFDYLKTINSNKFDLKLFVNLFKKNHSAVILKHAENWIRNAEKRLLTCTIKNTITIYRGFSVAQHSDVRKNRKCIDNCQKHTQDSGSSVSFTFDKLLASSFAAHPIVRNNDIGDFERRINASRLTFHTLNIRDDAYKSGESIRAYVGKYVVDKDDIFVNLSGTGEDEVLVNPCKVKLIRYDPISYT